MSRRLSEGFLQREGEISGPEHEEEKPQTAKSITPSKEQSQAQPLRAAPQSSGPGTTGGRRKKKVYQTVFLWAVLKGGKKRLRAGLHTLLCNWGRRERSENIGKVRYYA